ncbi:MAG TPA: tetratricopeptide repeat protein [Chroococcales cyanobacterium]
MELAFAGAFGLPLARLPGIPDWQPGCAFAQGNSGRREEQYIMDGKAVPKSFYDASTLVSQGLSLLHANRNQEACLKFKDAVAIAPDFAEAHHNYGLALAKTGQLAPAEEQFKLAIKLNPTLDGSWLSLGGLYQSTGRIADAIEAYTQFMRRFPGNRDAEKVSSLIEGLEKVQAAKAASGNLKLPPPVGDDYLADVDSDGINRWPASKFPLKVYVADGTGVPGYSPAYGTILKSSFQDWAKCSKGLISFVFVNDRSKADIECSWLADSSKLSNSAESGETRMAISAKYGIVHGTIKLLTMPILPGQKVTDNSVRMMCLHEIGHVLGLTGHTTNPDDTMFYSSTISARWNDLSERDSNTIIRLYSPNQATTQTPAAVTPAPQPATQ